LEERSASATLERGAAKDPPVKALIAITTAADNSARGMRLFINSLDLNFLPQ
jgi:hypothetical protein